MNSFVIHGSFSTFTAIRIILKLMNSYDFT